MEKIKIVYIIDKLEIGGTEKQLLELISFLDKNCFEPTLVCLRHSDYFDGVQVACHRRVLGVTRLLSFKGVLRLLQFSRWLMKNHIDIVQTYFFDATVFGVLSAKLAGVKKIISCRRDLGFWYTPSLLKILRITNKMTDMILVNSMAIKSNVIEKEKCHPHKIHVIYNGIDLNRFNDNHSLNNDDVIRKTYNIKGEKIVGIVANLNRRVKRVDLFIHAAAEICKTQKNISFVIVGDGCLKNELEYLAGKLRIKDYIHFVGKHNDIVQWLRFFDVGVLTSETEGFSNSLLEYLAVGLPVVCTDSGGNIELVKNGVNGYRFDYEDSQMLSKKIMKVLSSYNNYCFQNKEKAKNFEWDRAIQNYSTIYQ